MNFDIGFDVAVILCGFYTISRSSVWRRGPSIHCQGVDCPVVDAVCGPATLYFILRVSTISHGLLAQGGQYSILCTK